MARLNGALWVAHLFFVFIHQAKSQPDTTQRLFNNQSAEDVLGSSLQFSSETTDSDTLGISLLVTPSKEFSNDILQVGSSLLCQSNQFSNISAELGDSILCADSSSPSEDLNSVDQEEEWLKDLKERINGPRYSSTPVKLQKEDQFDSVKAKQKTAKHLNSYLCKEVQGAKKLKLKAMDTDHIKHSLRQRCLCGQNCMSEVSGRAMKNLRLSYWSQSITVREHLLKLYIKRSWYKGKHRFMNIQEDLSVCSKAFLLIFRINKNALTRGIKACDKDNSNTPGRCPRKVNENTLLTINWLEDYASFYGDRMPNTGDVKLPYKFRKLSVYKSYHKEVENPVSKSQFFKLWKIYFPHLKIKQTNSFSKCATCTLLEKHRENAVDFETKALYGQLKDEHHERQHMERRYYYGKRDASRKCPMKSMSLIIDGMDQAKTNLPHFSGRLSKDVNPADLLKTRVTGVINHGCGGFHTYVDINEYPHDPNLTINVLLRALKKAAASNSNTLPPVLYLQADNCGRENKNKYVLAFLELLVKLDIFHEVHLSFLYVGHTHEDIDAAFSKVSNTLKTCDVETLPGLLKILPDSDELSTIYNVKEWIEPHLASLSKISFPLHYKFEKNQNDVKMWYKGQHHLQWIEAEEEILNCIPNGVPCKVKPDYSKMNVEKNLKQIGKLSRLFKNEETVEFWQNFYKSIENNRRMMDTSSWILDELPRQKETDDNIDCIIEIPQHMKDIIEKEKRVPQVIIKKKTQKKKTVQPQKERASKDGRKPKQRKGNDEKRRRPVKSRSVFMAIPLTEDVKRHIWLFIFIAILEMVMLLLTLFVMMLLTYLCNILCVIRYLESLFQSVLTVHVGSFFAQVQCIFLLFDMSTFPVVFEGLQRTLHI